MSQSISSFGVAERLYHAFDVRQIKNRLDLRQIHNDIHSGDEKNRAAFNIASGIFCSQLEERILGEGATGRLLRSQTLPGARAPLIQVCGGDYSSPESVED